MNFGRVYDKAGQPIDWDRWRELKFADDYARIGLDVWPPIDAEPGAAPLVTISTVWLGLDHNYSMHGPPIIFETMIFGGPLSNECTRYATEEQAQAGHRRTVEDFAAGRMPWFLVDEMHPDQR